ncbi:hypothetical protein [Staphylococcus aureus]|uniref:hypothetical protein n=1 Tax=Staphylococcus aureus TaxID=1280 RepID=UPI001C83A1C5|nr:hypothetical protein [Staphylococcus aureus]
MAIALQKGSLAKSNFTQAAKYVTNLKTNNPAKTQQEMQSQTNAKHKNHTRFIR